MADKIQVPPHSDEAENCILGSLLIDKDAISSCAEFLRPEHFYKTPNKLIYQAILDLYQDREPIDIVTVKEELKKAQGLTKAGGSAYLTQLVNSVPTSAHVEQYANIVKNNYTKRELISAAARISESSFDETQEAAQALDKAEALIFGLSQKHLRQAFIPIKEALAESFDRLDELHKTAGGLRGVATGFKDLDNTLAGMQASNLLILAARPGTGKTALALNIAQYVSVKDKKPVGFFSLEMSKEELVDRLLVSQADIDAWRLKTGKLDENDFSKLSDAMGVMAESTLFIDDTPALSVLEMRTKARRLMSENGLSLIIVDYLQLASSIRQRDNRVQEVSEISQGLKNLARELKVPVLAISQLSRAVESRGGVKRPQLSDLRECLVGETLVLRADTGQRCTLESLYHSKEKVSLLAMNNVGKIVSAKAEKVTYSGKKDVFRLTSRSGREIIASGNHPFLTPDDGWIALENLKPKDLISVPEKLPYNLDDKVSFNKARLLGYLVSDGSYKKHRACGFTNADLIVANDAMRIAEKEFGVVSRTDDHNNACNIEFVSIFKNGYGKPGGNNLINWLKEIGIHGQGTANKRVPDVIFQSSNKVVSEFLKGLFTGDGTIVHRKSGRWEVKYSSKNKDLIKDVFHLLLRFGISSSMRQGRKGVFEIFTLEINDRDNIGSFVNNINFIGKKSVRASICGKEVSEKGTNPRGNLFPISTTTMVANLKNEAGLSWRDLGYRCQNKRMSRLYLKKVAEKLSDKKLKMLSESDLYWEEIKSIEPIGKENTYDICVPAHHNFIANDILVHNSGAIEQDADVVMFLYREDDEDLENINLEIAKHRNGPLRRIHLRFRGDRIKFYSAERRREEEKK
ncbi:MAG: replicative DNA helicase [Patescibacteria group bacterium]|nr:replicative DNA helicase [Patescibacteria group bacterium]